ncbi:hypothetical protein CEXT_514971 [Caerostris extrusa]|uniref:Bro-N domain-containing protein n=1 Tax=Caerostris extrusa TaxID=172846 RepID=A0AAV4RLZ9_CAEEX|nr:hypothetical protein CEXT_514971 [Caerostris extrusa]
MSIQNKVVSFAGVDIEVASIVHDDQVWLLANPFARILGFQRLNDAIQYAVTSSNLKSLAELGGRVAAPSRGNPIQKRSKFINRAGLFELIDKSRMPRAIEFKHWVNNDLLPNSMRLVNIAWSRTRLQLRPPRSMPSTKLQASTANRPLGTKKGLNSWSESTLRTNGSSGPERDLVRHILLVMKKPDVDEYCFVRRQRRDIARGRQQAVDKGFTEQLAEFKDIPNGVNVMNRLKERIPPAHHTTPNLTQCYATILNL